MGGKQCLHFMSSDTEWSHMTAGGLDAPSHIHTATPSLLLPRHETCRRSYRHCDGKKHFWRINFASLWKKIGGEKEKKKKQKHRTDSRRAFYSIYFICSMHAPPKASKPVSVCACACVCRQAALMNSAQCVWMGLFWQLRQPRPNLQVRDKPPLAAPSWGEGRDGREEDGREEGRERGRHNTKWRTWL